MPEGEGEETAAGHWDTGGNIQFTEPDTQPWILTSSISLSMTSFHADTVNKSLTLSTLLCSPVLSSPLGNTFCQFTQQLPLPTDGQNTLISISTLVSPDRILKFMQSQILLYFFLTFFPPLNRENLFLNTGDAKDMPFKSKVLGSFSALIHAA